MQSLRRFLAVFTARNREFTRDLGNLGWTFSFPFLIIVAFSYVFDLDSLDSFKMARVGPGAQELAAIDLVEHLDFDDRQAALERLRLHRVDLVVEASEGEFTYWMNESSPKSRLAATLFLYDLQQRPQPPGVKRQLIEAREIRYIDWLFPGLITMNVMWMALWGVGWVIVRQRKLGVLKRFKASPLTALEYLLAQVCSRLVILIICGVIVFVGGLALYPFQVEGSYLDLLLIYTLGCLALGSFGLAVAARMTSDEFASGILNFVSIPMMFLSEIWFSLEGSPEWVFYLAQCMPLYHMTDAFRQVMNEGASLADVSGSLGVLVLITVIFTAVGALSFKWTAER